MTEGHHPNIDLRTLMTNLQQNGNLCKAKKSFLKKPDFSPVSKVWPMGVNLTSGEVL
jgi:hypothetical protein